MEYKWVSVCVCMQCFWNEKKQTVFLCLEFHKQIFYICTGEAHVLSHKREHHTQVTLFPFQMSVYLGANPLCLWYNTCQWQLRELLTWQEMTALDIIVTCRLAAAILISSAHMLVLTDVGFGWCWFLCVLSISDCVTCKSEKEFWPHSILHYWSILLDEIYTNHEINLLMACWLPKTWKQNIQLIFNGSLSNGCMCFEQGVHLCSFRSV